MNKKILSFISVFVLITVWGCISAQSELIVCDKAPTETIACEENIDRDQYLEAEIKVSTNGTADTVWGKTIYFILLSQDFIYSDSVSFNLLLVTNSEKKEALLVDTYHIMVKPDWNYCWKAWTFMEEGLYNVEAFIGNNFVASGQVIIHRPGDE